MAHSERFLKIVEQAKTRIAEITPDETLARMEAGNTVLVVDTREDNEWERGRIRGAVHIGKGVIERDIEGVTNDPDCEIILYCGGGFRSALAAEALQQMGYTNVKSMAEGWRGWTTRGFPTEGGEG